MNRTLSVILLATSLLASVQPVHVGPVTGLKDCAPETVRLGVNDALRDLEGVCGVQFRAGTGGLVIRTGATKPALGYVAGAVYIAPNLILLGTDDPRSWNRQRVFMGVRHEAGHWANLRFPSNPADPFHSLDRASPMHLNGSAKPWDPVSKQQLVARFGAPVPVAADARWEVAKLILAQDEFRKRRIAEWYANYLFRPVSQVTAADYAWHLRVWREQGAEACEAGILAGAWDLCGRDKLRWIDHAHRRGLVGEPAWGKAGRAPRWDEAVKWSEKL